MYRFWAWMPKHILFWQCHNSTLTPIDAYWCWLILIDVDAVNPISNTRSYTRQSVPSSPGRSFLALQGALIATVQQYPSATNFLRFSLIQWYRATIVTARSMQLGVNLDHTLGTFREHWVCKHPDITCVVDLTVILIVDNNFHSLRNTEAWRTSDLYWNTTNPM